MTDTKVLWRKCVKSNVICQIPDKSFYNHVIYYTVVPLMSGSMYGLCHNVRGIEIVLFSVVGVEIAQRDV